MSRAASSLFRVLRKRADFLAAAPSGKKWVAPGLIVQMGASRREDSRTIRYGLTASGKIGSAVVRNRARRRLRALAVEILPRACSTGTRLCSYRPGRYRYPRFCGSAARISPQHSRNWGHGMNKISRLSAPALCGLIHVYRYSLAAIFGGQCRFTPSCSAYALEAIKTHGPRRARACFRARRAAVIPLAKTGANTALIPCRRVLSKRTITRLLLKASWTIRISSSRLSSRSAFWPAFSIFMSSRSRNITAAANAGRKSCAQEAASRNGAR